MAEVEPLTLAPVFGLPRLRSLTIAPGALADPLEIAELTGLEYLELGAEEWRVLLDADAIPPSLQAAAVETRGAEQLLTVVDLANEILDRWDRPLITYTTLQADLGPMA